MWDARRATMRISIYYITYIFILRASGSTYVSEFLIYIIHAHDAHGAISEIITFTLIAIDDASLHTLYMYTLRKYRPPRST